MPGSEPPERWRRQKPLRFGNRSIGSLSPFLPPPRRATARGKPAAITAPSSPLSFMYSLQVDKLGLPFALTAGMYGVPLPRPGDRRR